MISQTKYSVCSVADSFCHAADSFCHAADSFCHVVDSFCHVVNSFCHVVDSICHVVDSFCHVVDSFCHVVDSFCHGVDSFCHGANSVSHTPNRIKIKLGGTYIHAYLAKFVSLSRFAFYEQLVLKRKPNLQGVGAVVFKATHYIILIFLVVAILIVQLLQFGIGVI